MLCYRVTWAREDWRSVDASTPFHPLYVPAERQGYGRFDNPGRYVALYAAASPQGAVGESLAPLASWRRDEVERTVDGCARYLVTISVPDDLVLLNLDDPAVLTDLDLRPSDVVARNRARSQEAANRVWGRRSASGLRWWSAWRPEWTNYVFWTEDLVSPRFPSLAVKDLELLTIEHEAVRVAADALPRELGS